MCKFFSFISNGDGKFLYFDADKRKLINEGRLTTPCGNKIENADSHSAIASFFGLKDDLCNKYEYLADEDKFVVDQINAKIDDRVEADRWAKSLPYALLIKLKNLGIGNSGNSNSGYRNSGNSNSGDRNSGNSNSGNSNSGNSNSGNRNSGYSNSGNSNSGDSNSGNSNSGDRNSGNSNSGYSNSGDSNSGNSNSGYSNSGNSNSGYSNSGNSNSGNSNSGYRNSGNSNSGDRNSGNFNSGNYNAGLFCTNTPNVRLFNRNSKIPRTDPRIQNILGLGPMLNQWVYLSEMTADEQNKYPSAQTTGGYLKKLEYKEAWGKYWKETSEDNRQAFLNLPFFDAGIFEEITGIKVEQPKRKKKVES